MSLNVWCRGSWQKPPLHERVVTSRRPGSLPSERTRLGCLEAPGRDQSGRTPVRRLHRACSLCGCSLYDGGLPGAGARGDSRGGARGRRRATPAREVFDSRRRSIDSRRRRVGRFAATPRIARRSRRRSDACDRPTVPRRSIKRRPSINSRRRRGRVGRFATASGIAQRRRSRRRGGAWDRTTAAARRSIIRRRAGSILGAAAASIASRRRPGSRGGRPRDVVSRRRRETSGYRTWIFRGGRELKSL